MRIVLFNTLPNGDLFFTKEFIRTIVNANPTHTFAIACTHFYSLYSDIENLEVLERPNDIGFQITSKDIDMSKGYYIREGSLYINVSLASNNGTIEHPQVHYYCNYNIEFPSLECLNKYFSDMIQGANTLEVEPKITYTNISQYDSIPTVLNGMRLDDIPIEVKSALNGPCIFYYNLKPRTSSKTSVDDDKNIEAVATKYPTYTIICAKETTVNLKNVLSLYDLNIRESPDGKNLLTYAYVASYCFIIISKDTGGALVIFNKHTMRSNFKQTVILFNSCGPSLYKDFKQHYMSGNKDLIPLSVYDSDTLLGEIGKIEPLSSTNLDLMASGGRRVLYRTRKNKAISRINKRYRGLENRSVRRGRKTNKRLRRRGVRLTR